MLYIFFIVSFLSSVAGAICGIGGGVIIKPVLDTLQLAGVSTVSFLSSCTVLSMSLYSVIRIALSQDNQLKISTGTPLAVGASVGGVIGKQIFNIVKKNSAHPDLVGSIQAIILAVIICFALLYTINKYRIHTKNIIGILPCSTIGLVLGIFSSFLGIGGGPINLVVLYYFFSMETKTAAQNSLYIILFSQIASLFTTIGTNSVPAFEISTLVLMIAGGITGGIVGRALNHQMDSKKVEHLFVVMMAVIIALCIYNAVRYAVK